MLARHRILERGWKEKKRIQRLREKANRHEVPNMLEDMKMLIISSGDSDGDEKLSQVKEKRKNRELIEYSDDEDYYSYDEKSNARALFEDILFTDVFEDMKILVFSGGGSEDERDEKPRRAKKKSKSQKLVKYIVSESEDDYDSYDKKSRRAKETRKSQDLVKYRSESDDDYDRYDEKLRRAKKKCNSREPIDYSSESDDDDYDSYDEKLRRAKGKRNSREQIDYSSESDDDDDDCDSYDEKPRRAKEKRKTRTLIESSSESDEDDYDSYNEKPRRVKERRKTRALIESSSESDDDTYDSYDEKPRRVKETCKWVNGKRNTRALLEYRSDDDCHSQHDLSVSEEEHSETSENTIIETQPHTKKIPTIFHRVEKQYLQDDGEEATTQKKRKHQKIPWTWPNEKAHLRWTVIVKTEQIQKEGAEEENADSSESEDPMTSTHEQESDADFEAIKRLYSTVNKDTVESVLLKAKVTERVKQVATDKKESEPHTSDSKATASRLPVAKEEDTANVHSESVEELCFTSHSTDEAMLMAPAATSTAFEATSTALRGTGAPDSKVPMNNSRTFTFDYENDNASTATHEKESDADFEATKRVYSTIDKDIIESVLLEAKVTERVKQVATDKKESEPHTSDSKATASRLPVAKEEDTANVHSESVEELCFTSHSTDEAMLMAPAATSTALEATSTALQGTVAPDFNVSAMISSKSECISPNKLVPRENTNKADSDSENPKSVDPLISTHMNEQDVAFEAIKKLYSISNKDTLESVLLEAKMKNRKKKEASVKPLSSNSKSAVCKLHVVKEEDEANAPSDSVKGLVKEFYSASNSMYEEVKLLVSQATLMASQGTDATEGADLKVPTTISSESERNSQETPAPGKGNSWTESANSLLPLDETKRVSLLVNKKDNEAVMATSTKAESAGPRTPPIAAQPTAEPVDFESIKRLYAAGTEVMNQVDLLKSKGKKSRSSKGNAARKKLHPDMTHKASKQKQAFPETSTRPSIHGLSMKASEDHQTKALVCDSEQRSEREESRDQAPDLSHCQSHSNSSSTDNTSAPSIATKMTKQAKSKSYNTGYHGKVEPDTIAELERLEETFSLEARDKRARIIPNQ